jgi:feruloyl esterase
MVPKSPDAVFNGSTSTDFLFSAYFPKYLSSFNSPTDITNLNLKFDKAEFELVNQLHGLYDPTDPDLRAFAAHGGKLLLWQGWADSGASPRMLLNYYDAMRTNMGATAVSAFVTLYMIPGEYHCAGGPTPVQQDFLTPLIQWREQGVHPHRVVISYEASATDPTVVKTRPVFPYPNVARYTGHGSINDAANFVESPPTQRFSDRYVWLGLDHYQPGQQIWCDQHGTSLVCRQGSK